MSSPNDPIHITIDGTSWNRPTQVYIEKNVDTISGFFSLTFPQFGDSQVMNRTAKIGKRIEISIDGKRLISGYTEIVKVSSIYTEKFVTISGRDVTGDLVDCEYTESNNEWKNQSVRNIIIDLCKPFGIKVEAVGKAVQAGNSIVDNFKATEGMCIQSLIAQICIDNSITPLSLGDGKLTLVNADDALGIKRKIVNPGDDVTGYEFTADDTNRFSNYTAKGQGYDLPNLSLSNFLQPNGSISDSIVSRKREKVIFPENPTNSDNCRKRAIWERNYCAGMSRLFRYTMANFTAERKKPWDIHTLIHVDDKEAGYNGELYCSSVVFKRENMVDTTDVFLVPKYTYSQEAKIKRVVVD